MMPLLFSVCPTDPIKRSLFAIIDVAVLNRLEGIAEFRDDLRSRQSLTLRVGAIHELPLLSIRFG